MNIEEDWQAWLAHNPPTQQKSDDFSTEAWLKRNPQYNSKATRFWRERVIKGTIGRVKPDYGGKGLAGKQLVFVGWLGGYPWMKLLEDAGDMKRGDTFAYMMQWVNWDD